MTVSSSSEMFLYKVMQGKYILAKKHEEFAIFFLTITAIVAKKNKQKKRKF